MTRKIVALLGLVAVLILATAYPLAAAPAKELTFVHGWDPVAWHFNPFIPKRVVFDEGTVECLAFFYKGKLMLEGKMVFEPWLAESWEWKTEDGYPVFYIYLRKGVLWHDGKEFTSKDVWTKFVIGKAFGWPIWSYVVKVETPDKYTVKVVCKSRGILTEYDLLYEYGRMDAPYHIYGKYAEMVAEGKVEEARKALMDFKPKEFVGTGPFKVEKVTSSEAILVKFDKYWKKDVLERMPDRIRLIRFTSNEQVWAMYMADKVDGGWYVLPPPTYEELRTKPWVYALYVVGAPEKKSAPMEIPDCSGMGIYFNYIKNKWLRDVRVRKAIAYAIDRKKVAVAAYATVFKPVDKPTSMLMANEKAWIKPEIWEKIPAYEYDPTKAEALLKEAGFTKKGGKWYTPEGEVFKLVLIAPAGYTDWAAGMENVAAQLKAFGIEAEYRAVETSAFWGEWIVNPHKYDWDLATGWWGGFHPHPWRGFYVKWIEYFYKETWPLHVGDEWNKLRDELFRKFDVPGVGAVDPEKVLDEWAMTVDPEKQKEYASILAYIVGEYLPILPLIEKHLSVYASSTRVDWAPKDHYIWFNAPGRCAEMMFFQFWVGLAKFKG